MTREGGIRLIWTLSILLTVFTGLAYGQNIKPVIQITYSDIIGVGELESATRVVYYFTVTDDPDKDWYTCDLKIDDIQGNDNDKNEFILKNTSRTGWQFEIAPGATFTYPEIYELEVECNDGQDKSEKVRFHAHVVPQQDIAWAYGGTESKPLFLVSGTQVNITNVDVSVTTAGTVVSPAIKVDDTRNLLYDYYLTGQSFSKKKNLAGSNGDYFVMDIGTGDLIALQDFQYIPDDIPRSDLNHYAVDNWLKIWGKGRVKYTGQNARPKITNLPLTENQPESITDADILFTLTIDDTAYAGQSITVRFDCTPSEWENIFELDGLNFKLRAGKRVDFENGNRDFSCDFTANDGLHDGDTKTYTCSITNVNEAPTVGDSLYYVEIDEGPSGGTAVASNIVCEDEDSANGAEPLTLTIASDTCSGMFTIDDAGMVSRATNVDVDAAGSITSCTMVITCADDEGASVTTNIDVTIKDINDNSPAITGPVSMTSYTTMVDGSTFIGALTPTDADKDVPNNQVTCDSAASTSTYAACFDIASNCDVVANCNGSYVPANELTTYTVTITDHGSPALTTTVTLNIRHQSVFVSTSTVTIPTTTQDEWFYHPENIALTALATLFGLIILTLLENIALTALATLFGLILLTLLGLCCLRYCWGRNLCCRILDKIKNCCKRRPKERPVTPITPPRRRTPPPRPKSPRLIRERTPPTVIVRDPGPPPDPIIMRVIERPKAIVRTLY